MRPKQPALIFIFITLFLDVLGIGLIVPVLPELIKELGGGKTDSASYTYGILMGLYALMQFIFAPIIGRLSDRYGRRPVILLALLGSGLDYFLLAWAPTLAWLYVGRIISGITGANLSAAAAYIADVSSKKDRSTSFGIIGAAFGLGFAFGPALGGWLGHIDLRMPFVVAGGLTLANWLYGLIILPESLKQEHRRPFDLKNANPFSAIMRLREHPLIKGLSRCYFISMLAHTVYPSIWVLYTAHRYEWDTKQTGLSLAYVGVMTAIVQGGFARLIIPKLGDRKTAVLGLSIMATSMTCYGLAPHGWIVYVIITFGAFSGIATPAIQGMISKSVGADEQGGIQGSLTSLQSVAGFVGPPMFSSLFGFFISKAAPVPLPGFPFFLAAGLCLIAVSLAAVCMKRPA